LYLVSLTGTTGARQSVSSQLAGLVERARAVTDLPLLAGFGISTPDQAAAAAELADGVVVGSRAVEVAADEGPAGLERYVRSLRNAVDALRPAVA
jgi:tryptophan synthase alpha chain